MRKRHITRPQLEPMEVRQVPSGLSGAALAAQVGGARQASVQAHADRQQAGVHATRSHAAAKARAVVRHHHAVKHAPAHTPHHSSGSNQKNFFSNFFKSIFGV